MGQIIRPSTETEKSYRSIFNPGVVQYRLSRCAMHGLIRAATLVRGADDKIVNGYHSDVAMPATGK